MTVSRRIRLFAPRAGVPFPNSTFSGLKVLGVAAVLLASTALTPAFAADPPESVGRVSAIDGGLQIYTTDLGTWQPAVVNYPVTTGASFFTADGARAEIQTPDGPVRLGGQTQIDVEQLDQNGTHLQVDQGAINLHLRDLPPGGLTIDTPRGAVQITAPGSYNIDTGLPNGDQPSAQTTVTAFAGQAQVNGVVVPAGSAAVLTDQSQQPQIEPAQVTSIDTWARNREHRIPIAPPPAEQSYIPPDVTGAEDLGGYGTWSDNPDYGHVWYPQVAADWAPYRDGHWAYVSPWGWTWVDDAPWGFAPFHYGRWVHDGGRWGWWPGDHEERAAYAPALVAFVGGNGWSLSVSLGQEAVGWVPLAPREPFYPSYQASPRYVGQINRTTVNNITINNITNYNGNTNNWAALSHGQHFRNAVGATAIPAAAFGGGRAVQRSQVQVPQARVAQAVNGAPVLPGATSSNAPHFFQRPAAVAPRETGEALAAKSVGGKTTGVSSPAAIPHAIIGQAPATVTTGAVHHVAPPVVAGARAGAQVRPAGVQPQTQTQAPAGRAATPVTPQVQKPGVVQPQVQQTQKPAVIQPQAQKPAAVQPQVQRAAPASPAAPQVQRATPAPAAPQVQRAAPVQPETQRVAPPAPKPPVVQPQVQKPAVVQPQVQKPAEPVQRAAPQVQRVEPQVQQRVEPQVQRAQPQVQRAEPQVQRAEPQVQRAAPKPEEQKPAPAPAKRCPEGQACK